MFSELEASYIGKPCQLPKYIMDPDLEAKVEDLSSKSRFMKSKCIFFFSIWFKAY